jgi:phosphoglycerate dehydrogenase-like enzyme
VRLAVLDDYQQVAASLADWNGALPGVDVVFFTDHLKDEDALVARLAPFDAVFAMRERTAFPRRVIERLPELRLIVTPGMRNAAIDVEAATDHGVVVCGTTGGGLYTAELTWGLIIALVRFIPREDASVRAGGWQQTVGMGLEGKTLGVVGLGRLGARVADVGRAFGMTVVAWSPNLTAERAAAQHAELVGKRELFERAHVATVHMVLSDRTRDLIGEDELRALGPSAYLVNTSRGPLVTESALVRALDEGWIAGAGLDVFDEEPLPLDHPLRRSPRTVITPHIGYVTTESYRGFFADIIEDVRAYQAGTPIRVLTA